MNTQARANRSLSALVFDIKRDCSEDGPGIRTTVFFKGCPLACVWCQNPEGIRREVGISFRRERCRPDRCGVPCVKRCPTGCLRLERGTAQSAFRRSPGIPDQAAGLEVRHALCTGCGQCVEVCPNQALETVGLRIDLDELLYRVLIDKPFFCSSGGGVTVSGGEPTLQMPFLGAFLRRLKEQGVSTAMETCGFFDYGSFRRRLLPWLDYIYYDLKLIDPADHRRWTGRDNRRILANLERLAGQTEVPVQVRIPLIPGITATERNLSGIARFLRAHGIKKASLMPYNPLWQDKLDRLGLERRYHHRGFMTPAEQAACVGFFAPDTSCFRG